MTIPQMFKSTTPILALLALAGYVGFSPSAQAAEACEDPNNKPSHAVCGIQEMCAQAADSVARQPEAEGKILSLLRDGFANITVQKDGSHGVPRAIGIIRAAAASGIARQPEAEGKILNIVDECETALDKLRHRSFFKY